MSTATDPVVWNPFDPVMRTDPYPVYQRLLAEDPVHENALGMLMLSRFTDCETVLRHPNASSDESKAPAFTEFVQAAEDPDELQRLLEMRPFLFLDPPDHTRLRGLVSKAFTPKTVERLRPRVELLVTELLDAVAAASGPVDLVSALAYPLPITIISEMLGVPAEDSDQFTAWSRALARSLDPEFVLPPEAVSARNTALEEFHAYFRRLIAARRHDPRDDVLSALVHAEEEGNRLTENELLATCTLLLVAGHETTVNLIANGALALMRNPAELQRLRGEPTLIKSAIEEMLRFDPPVQLTGRLVLDDIAISDRTLSAGLFVVLLIGAANRDPAMFTNPNDFMVNRPDVRHLSFGLGHHFCLGAPLARLEAQAALGQLVQRFPDLALATDSLQYRENLVLRGLESLPVRVA
jgi:unspecific monooxygenase